MAKRAVVHIQRAFKNDFFRVYVQGISLVNAVVDHSAQQVVCRGHGVNVAGKMQVDVLHGQHLRISAACGAALNAEYGAKGGLAQRNNRLFADSCHRVAEADCRGCLAFAGRRGADGGNEHKLAVRAVLERVVHSGFHFCLIVAVQLEAVLGNMQLFCNIDNFLHFRVLRDLYVRQHNKPPLFCRICPVWGIGA